MKKYYYDGKYYQAKVRISDNIADGYKTLRARTVADLEKKIAQFNHEKLSGRDMTQDIIVAEWIRLWWNNRAGEMSESVKSYRRPMINNVIGPAIGARRVSTIRPEDLRSIMASCSSRSSSYCSKLQQLLKQIFYAAYDNGLCIKNPAEKLTGNGTPAEEKHAISSEQWETLRTAVSGTRAELFCNLGYYTGMRREEICGLEWSCVHLEASTPHIEVVAACTWPDRKRPVWPSPLKTKASKRMIPIHADLLPVLYEAYTDAHGDGMVIHSREGGPISYMSMRRLWGIVDDRTAPEYLPKSRIRNEGKKTPNIKRTINFSVTPHILRHTFATNLIAAGVDIKTAQYLTGHSRIQTLLDIYAHVRKDDSAALAAAVGKI